MPTKRQMEILGYAYFNDLVSNLDFKEKELDDLLKQGLLENKHKSPKGAYIYWISGKGLKILKNHLHIKRR